MADNKENVEKAKKPTKEERKAARDQKQQVSHLKNLFLIKNLIVTIT